MSKYADTKWPWFLTTLGVTVNNKIPTLQDMENLSWAEKQDLLNKDPIKTAMLFQHMVLTLISHLRHPACPLGKMTDFFYRVEGQKRGKLHLHIITYHENAVDYEKGKNEEEVIKYVDKHIVRY